ncbi:MAG: CrcB family protein [Pseudobdellovibrionaceae bacterium]
MNTFLAIGLLGLLGIFSRYGLDLIFFESNPSFPVSTFLINILGSLLAGLIYVMAHRYNIAPQIHTALLVGFCGGFTTFSAYSLQTMHMLERGQIGSALLYLTLSPILGLAFAYLPVLISTKI